MRPRALILGLLTGVLFATVQLDCRATDYYLDPNNGNLGNDGRSRSNAWSSLAEVAQAGYLHNRVTGGDTLYLMHGKHGRIDVDGLHYNQEVKIVRWREAVAVLSQFWAEDCHNLTLEGLYVTAMLDGYVEQQKGMLVVGRNGGGESSNIKIHKCTIFSQFDTSGWGAWEWGNRASSGIYVWGTDMEITNNIVQDVHVGIQILGDRIRVQKNWVHRFSGDAMKAAGDDHEFISNIMTDCFDAYDGYHHDALQFYNGRTQVERAKIIGNIVIHPLDRNRGNIAHLQGIAAFGDVFIDGVVENNIVISDTSHGISLNREAVNTRVVNNTVYGFINGNGSPIRVIGRNNGNVVRNNLTTNLVVDSGNTQDHNFIVTQANAPEVFVDPDRFLFLIRAEGPAVDTGEMQDAPEVDFRGCPRPSGATVDIGAQEHDE